MIYLYFVASALVEHPFEACGPNRASIISMILCINVSKSFRSQKRRLQFDEDMAGKLMPQDRDLGVPVSSVFDG